MNYVLALVLLFCAVTLVFFYFALVEKILFTNKTEEKEAKRMLGGFSYFWRGKLAHDPSALGDYRTTRGLAVNKAQRKIELQSTLSTEKLRAVFNR